MSLARLPAPVAKALLGLIAVAVVLTASTASLESRSSQIGLDASKADVLAIMGVADDR